MTTSAFARLRNRTSLPLTNRLFGVKVRLTGDGGQTSNFVARRDDTLAAAIGVGRATVTTWMLPQCQCDFGSGRLKPKAGFNIVELDDETGATVNLWEISAPDPSTPAVEPDHHDHDWICHVRRVD